MPVRTALVTGASGFVGRHIVHALAVAQWRVRAGIHHEKDRSLFAGQARIEPVVIELGEPGSLPHALQGVDHLYHCAALVDSHATRDQLVEVNAVGTRRVWEAASASGVRRALYCSTAAVYGLLGKNGDSITEHAMPRAIEPYGYSKLEGENAAREVATRTGLHTTIIRPVAIFGPGEHTPFGSNLRDAALSKILLAGGFQGKKFSFVHVEDVADAAVHVMGLNLASGEVFNVVVNEPILFEQAFREYVTILKGAGRAYAKVRMLAAISSALHKSPAALRWASTLLGDRYVFGIWHPGFDLTYSSKKLLSTSFEFRWEGFGPTFASCIEKAPGQQA